MEGGSWHPEQLSPDISYFHSYFVLSNSHAESLRVVTATTNPARANRSLSLGLLRLICSGNMWRYLLMFVLAVWAVWLQGSENYRPFNLALWGFRASFHLILPAPLNKLMAQYCWVNVVLENSPCWQPKTEDLLISFAMTGKVRETSLSIFLDSSLATKFPASVKLPVFRNSFQAWLSPKSQQNCYLIVKMMNMSNNQS